MRSVWRKGVKEMDTYLGIDYGGTKLLIGEVREDGGAF